ncbi:hypothetical protein EB844_07025 [Paracoccus pantotrophus]|nr:hypothetical protein EB844_07025 [Paracoccus pantotrophus]
MSQQPVVAWHFLLWMLVTPSVSKTAWEPWWTFALTSGSKPMLSVPLCQRIASSTVSSRSNRPASFRMCLGWSAAKRLPSLSFEMRKVWPAETFQRVVDRS